jgi:hypothetical protein
MNFMKNGIALILRDRCILSPRWRWRKTPDRAVTTGQHDAAIGDSRPAYKITPRIEFPDRGSRGGVNGHDAAGGVTDDDGFTIAVSEMHHQR